jgi:hypothetical protein
VAIPVSFFFEVRGNVVTLGSRSGLLLGDFDGAGSVVLVLEKSSVPGDARNGEANVGRSIRYGTAWLGWCPQMSMCA